MKIDIAKILENAPKGIKLYSPAYGIIELVEVKNTPYCDGTLMATEIKAQSLYSRKDISFDCRGRLYIDGECMLFPSLECKDWTNWQQYLFPQSVGSFIVDSLGGVFRIVDDGYHIMDSAGAIFEFKEIGYIQFRYATEDEISVFEDFYKRNRQRNFYLKDKKNSGKETIEKNKRMITKCDDCKESEKGACIRQCDEKHIPWRNYPIPDKKDIENENDSDGCAISSDSHSCVQTDGDLEDSTTTKTPKFKEGDWVANNDGTFHDNAFRIEFVGDNVYRFEKPGDYVNICDVDENYHKWSIEDANPGDVLRSEHYVFIYKEIDPNNHPMVMSFCDCRIEDDICLTTELCNECDKICSDYECKPATPQEKKMLFDAIHKNGYLWDSDELYLKRIDTVESSDTEPGSGRKYVPENMDKQFEISDDEAIKMAYQWVNSNNNRVDLLRTTIMQAYFQGVKDGYEKAVTDGFNIFGGVEHNQND